MHTAWTRVNDVEEFLRKRGDGIVFKHSSRCSVSDVVRERVWEPFLTAHPDIPCFEVLVVEHRPASNLLAEKLCVRHESPQAIVVRGGQAIWDESHLRITAEALEEAWRLA